jgi:hypothetical protein
MKRKAVRSDVINLGPATRETRGAWGVFSDEVPMRNLARARYKAASIATINNDAST